MADLLEKCGGQDGMSALFLDSEDYCWMQIPYSERRLALAVLRRQSLGGILLMNSRLKQI